MGQAVVKIFFHFDLLTSEIFEIGFYCLARRAGANRLKKIAALEKRALGGENLLLLLVLGL
jgi:hypothetical protein